VWNHAATHASGNHDFSTKPPHNQPMREFVVIGTALMILAGFIAYPKESGDAMAQVIAIIGSAVTTIVPLQQTKGPDKPALQNTALR
jgi:hypothetical protein